jgi:hypothetical protein
VTDPLLNNRGHLPARDSYGGGACEPQIAHLGGNAPAGGSFTVRLVYRRFNTYRDVARANPCEWPPSPIAARQVS